MNFKSQIAPKGLQFNSDEFRISDKYATILTVISYPRYIGPGYLSDITNLTGVKLVVKHITLDEISEITSDTAENNLHHEVFSVLSQLDEKYKSVILLHYLEGFSIKEVSSILKISESNVKMRLVRGREMMKVIITKEENDV